MRIGICDGEETWRVKIENLLSVYSRQEKIDLTVIGFSGLSALNAHNDIVFHILFMDIEFGDNHGVDLAGQISEQWPGCQIIFLARELTCVLNVYKVQHLCVVLKQQLEARLSEIMDKAMLRLRKWKCRIVFKIHRKAFLVLPPEEIMLLERDKRITRIVSTRGEFITNEKLGSLIERLPVIDFVRCHNSYIVYIPAVELYEKNVFVMKDGRRIVISRGYEEKTKKAYERWKKLRV